MKKNKGNDNSAAQKSAAGKKSGFSVKHLKFYFILILIAAILGGAIYLYNKITSDHIETRHAELYSQVQKVAELTVLKNRYCDVICVRSAPEVKVGRVSAIVKYNGILRAGIQDVTAIDINVSGNDKTAEVYVPHSVVLDNTLEADKLELFDEKTFLFVKRVPTQELFNGISEQMKIKEQELVEDGILNEADGQLRSVIEGMLRACGFEEIIFHWK